MGRTPNFTPSYLQILRSFTIMLDSIELKAYLEVRDEVFLGDQVQKPISLSHYPPLMKLSRCMSTSSSCMLVGPKYHLPCTW